MLAFWLFYVVLSAFVVGLHALIIKHTINKTFKKYCDFWENKFSEFEVIVNKEL